jgi:hypothetical protein
MYHVGVKGFPLGWWETYKAVMISFLKVMISVQTLLTKDARSVR